MRKVLAWLLLVVGLCLAGCGGGGGSGGGGSVALFATDDLNAGYSGVWVSVHRIELLTPTGAVLSYDDTEGRVLNVRALSNGGTQHFAFFGEDSVPAGTFTGIRVTLDDDVTLFPVGQASGLARKFDGLDPSGKKVLALAFAAPKNLGGGRDSLVVDFKLENWTEDGTFVRNAEIAEGSASGIDDPNRHEEDNFRGTVGALSGTAPNQTLKLHSEHGVSLTVRTSADTAVFNGNGAPNPVLANGKRVKVRGKFSPSDNALLATSIKIRSNDPDDPHEVKGPSSEPNLGARTFRVLVREAEGFQPTTDFVTVSVNPETTRFVSRGGLRITMSQFFAILMEHPGIEVEAEGVLQGEADPVLVARKVKIEDEDEFGEAEAKGTVLSMNPVAGSLVMSLLQWEGFVGRVGRQVSVTTSGETEFIGDDGEALTKEQFFALLQVGGRVEAKGRFSEGTLAAIRMKLEDLDEAEARGSVLNVDSQNFRFDLVLVEWEGFRGAPGQVIHVTTTPSTTFRNFEGEPINRTSFFGLLQNGWSVQAEGSFDPGSSTLAAVKAKLEDD